MDYETTASRITEVLDAPTNNLRSLVAIAGLDPTKDLMGIPFPKASLADQDLSRFNLSECDLRGANLIGANLTGADLTGANLTGADLTGANLTGANLTGADLTGANLTPGATVAHAVIAMYDDADRARKVVQEMVEAGFSRDTIDLLNGGPQGSETVVEKLVGRGIDRPEAQIYANELGRGDALVMLETEDENVERALDIMERNGPRDLDQLTAELRPEKSRPVAATVAQGKETVPVIGEELRVGKRPIGKRPVTPVEETVREETVAVEWPLTPEEREQAFQRKTIEVTETGEEVVVSKEARVVGEVALRKTATEHKEKVHATGRRTDVEVKDIQPKTQKIDQR